MDEAAARNRAINRPTNREVRGLQGFRAFESSKARSADTAGDR